MSLDAIKKSILGEAEARASAIDAEADSEATRIVKEAEAKAKSIVESAEQDAKREVERLWKEAEAGAETEASSMILEAKGEVVEKALKRVTAQVGSELSKNSMKKILDSGLKQFKELADGDIIIKTGKKNAPLVKDSKFRVEYGDVDGFMLYSDNGKVALNATISSIVERSKDSARKLIANELFKGGTTRKRTQSKVSAKRGKGKKR